MASKSVRGPSIETSSRNRLAYVQKKTLAIMHVFLKEKKEEKKPRIIDIVIFLF